MSEIILDINDIPADLLEFFEPVEFNRTSVMPLKSEPFSGPHYATFPTELPRICILAGCPERCCPACGKGWVRIVKSDSNWQERKSNGAWAGNVGVSDNYQNGVHGKGMSHDLGGNRQTLGFHPACSCNSSAPPVPGLVLDPFMGSGTVALVARQLGRDYLGTEINYEYVKIARDRLRLPFEARHVVDTSTLDGLPLFSQEAS